MLVCFNALIFAIFVAYVPHLYEHIAFEFKIYRIEWCINYLVWSRSALAMSELNVTPECGHTCAQCANIDCDTIFKLQVQCECECNLHARRCQLSRHPTCTASASVVCSICEARSVSVIDAFFDALLRAERRCLHRAI